MAPTISASSAATIWSSFRSPSATRGQSTQKQKLYRRIVERLADNPGMRPEDVFINLVEVLPENWSFGNGRGAIRQMIALPAVSPRVSGIHASPASILRRRARELRADQPNVIEESDRAIFDSATRGPCDHSRPRRDAARETPVTPMSTARLR